MGKPKRPPHRQNIPPRRSTGAAGRGQPVRRPSASAQRQARRRRYLWAGGAMAAAVVVIAVVIGVGLSSNSAQAAPRTPLTAAEATKVTSVPLTALVAASGKVTLQAAQPLQTAPLTSGGKPELLYIGAEFCPYCAAERWALTVALSQFGTFSNLQKTSSAVHDGDISTLSFYGATYSSPYLVFRPVETTTNQPRGNSYAPLEQPTAAETSLWSSLTRGSVPLTDIGGKYFLDTSQYPFTTLSGQSFDSIAGQLGDNATNIGTSIDASAAALAKYVCSITSQQPASTCRAVAQVAAPLSSGSSSSSSGG